MMREVRRVRRGAAKLTEVMAQCQGGEGQAARPAVRGVGGGGVPIRWVGELRGTSLQLEVG
jgi:hypothetical protein